MNAPRIAVVIPAYNAASFIIEALDSVLAQSLATYEILVVDDGSADNTAELVRQWMQAHPATRLHLLRQPNGGISNARNNAIQQAESELIALLDADDVWESGHLEQLYAALTATPNALAAYGAGRLLVDGVVQPRLYDDFWDQPAIKLGRPVAGTEYLQLDRGIVARLMKGNFIKPSSLLVRRDAMLRVGLFDETLRVAEDRDFLVRLVLDGDIAYVPQPLTRYRWHDDNATAGKNSRRNMEATLLALATIQRHSGTRLSASQLAALETERSEVIRAYLYTCARAGWRAYSGALRYVGKLYGAGQLLPRLHPKHFVHCLLAPALK